MQTESKTALVVEPFEHGDREYWAGDVLDIKDYGIKNYLIIRHNQEVISSRIEKMELNDHIFLNT